MIEKEIRRPMNIDTWCQACDRAFINMHRARFGLGPLGQERARTWSQFRDLFSNSQAMKIDRKISEDLKLDQVAERIAARQAKARYN